MNERDELQAEIDKDKPVLEPVIKGELSEDTMAALRAWGVPASVTSSINMLDIVLTDFKKEFHAYRDQRFRESKDEKIERRERQDQTDRNFEQMNARIARLQWVVIVAMVILAFLIGGRFL